jgi:hypothetical protein
MRRRRADTTPYDDRGRLFRSRFRADWKGVVLDRREDICLVLILIDRHGNPMKRRIIRTLNMDWLVDTGAQADLSSVNPDWLVTSPALWKYRRNR